MKKEARKKAQAFYIEFIAAIAIVTAVLLMYSTYGPDIAGTSKINEMVFEANRISDAVLSSGYPYNWTSETVERLGLTNGNHRINNTKLQGFLNLSYETTRFLFGMNYDYYIFFRDRESNILPVDAGQEGLGKPGINSTNILTDDEINHLVKIYRYLVWNSDIVKMEVYIWSQ